MGRERRRLQGPHAGNLNIKRYAPSLGSPASILPSSTRHTPSQSVELYVQHRFRALGLDQNCEIQAYVVEVKYVLVLSRVLCSDMAFSPGKHGHT